MLPVTCQILGLDYRSQNVSRYKMTINSVHIPGYREKWHLGKVKKGSGKEKVRVAHT